MREALVEAVVARLSARIARVWRRRVPGRRPGYGVGLDRGIVRVAAGQRAHGADAALAIGTLAKIGVRELAQQLGGAGRVAVLVRDRDDAGDRFAVVEVRQPLALGLVEEEAVLRPRDRIDAEVVGPVAAGVVLVPALVDVV